MSSHVVVIGGVVVSGAVGALLAWLMFSSVQPSTAEMAAAHATIVDVVDAGVAPATDAPATSPHSP